MSRQKPDQSTNWGKVLAILSTMVIVGGVLWGIWFGDIVPDNISTKVITQSLITTLIVFLVIAVIFFVKKGKL